MNSFLKKIGRGICKAIVFLIPNIDSSEESDSRVRFFCRILFWLVLLPFGTLGYLGWGCKILTCQSIFLAFLGILLCFLGFIFVVALLFLLFTVVMLMRDKAAEFLKKDE